MQLLLCPALARLPQPVAGAGFRDAPVRQANAAEVLRRELARPGVPQPIALGINTDAYQPIERRWRITRQLIEVMLETRHPFSLITKNALVERDLDLLAPLAAMDLVHVHFSVTTLDNRLSSKLEPRAARRMPGCAR
jgi:DNA repair photolyase